jgi:N-acetylglucosaminyldiphosphoundecaprenol N-acetyl-beta-D-mannosaminyltransferase
MTNGSGRAERAEVLGCAFDRVDIDGAVCMCEEAILRRDFTQHMAVNAAKLVSMQDDPQLRRFVNDCELVTADGQAVVWASTIVGDPLPGRVAGIDLMLALIQRAARRGYRVFILGARQEVLETAIANLRARYPLLEIAGCRDGYFSDDEEADVVRQIRESRADILFVAMSSPRKEYFLGTYREQLQVPFVMGVGGSIDVVAGLTQRAPRLMQRLGLEWLFRLIQEPRRLFRRYLVSNTRFFGMLANEIAGRSRGRSGAA